MHLGQTAVAAGQDYVQKNVSFNDHKFCSWLMFFVVWNDLSQYNCEAPLQRVEFIRDEQDQAGLVSLVAQTVGQEDQEDRTWAARMAASKG